MSLGPTFRGMFTIRDRSSGPGPSSRCLPKAKPKPAPIATRRMMVNTPLPATTRGCRARREGRLGSGTRSGSNAARGLRNDSRFSDGAETPGSGTPCNSSGAYASTPEVKSAPVPGDGTLRGSAVMTVRWLACCKITANMAKG